jgi:hypothetical protein
LTMGLVTVAGVAAKAMAAAARVSRARVAAATVVEAVQAEVIPEQKEVMKWRCTGPGRPCDGCKHLWANLGEY